MFLILFLTSPTRPTPNIAMYCVYICICILYICILYVYILLNGHIQQLLYVANTKLFSEAKKQSQGPFSPNPATNKHIRRFIRISKPTHCNPGGWQLWTPIDFIDNDPKFFLEGIISGKGLGLVFLTQGLGPDPWVFFGGMSLFWVVVSSICYFHPDPWKEMIQFEKYFSNGLKPPAIVFFQWSSTFLISSFISPLLSIGTQGIAEGETDLCVRSPAFPAGVRPGDPTKGIWGRVLSISWFGCMILVWVSVCCLFVCLFVCLVGWLVGWLVVWLVGWLFGWLVGWLVVGSW